MLRFPLKNGLHDIARVAGGSRQGPIEALRRGKLTRGPRRSRMAPQVYEASDSAAFATKDLHPLPGGTVGERLVRSLLCCLHEPFHQDARFRIRETAREGVV